MQHERYGTRRLEYSQWHRTASTTRFVGHANALKLAMIDIDVQAYVEYNKDERLPIALIEVAEDRGQSYKSAYILKALAMRAQLPCFAVLYKLSPNKNPTAPDHQDIDSFRVKRLWPNPQKDWDTITPAEWAKRLLAARKWSCKKHGFEALEQSNAEWLRQFDGKFVAFEHYGA